MTKRRSRGWWLWLYLGWVSYGYAHCTLVSGQLIQLPARPLFKFQFARKATALNYPLSHTSFYIRDYAGGLYQVILDNLYYTYLSLAQVSLNKDIGISADLRRRFPAGSSVEVCGKLQRRHQQRVLNFAYVDNCHVAPKFGFIRINGQQITSISPYCGNCACAGL